MSQRVEGVLEVQLQQDMTQMCGGTCGLCGLRLLLLVVLYPSCNSAKYVLIDWMTWLPAHFVAIRRTEWPTTMGLMPPPFLFKAIKEVPKKVGHTDGELLPSRVRLTKEVSAYTRSSPSFQADVLTISFRCCRQRPSGPPSAPLGK